VAKAIFGEAIKVASLNLHFMEANIDNQTKLLSDINWHFHWQSFFSNEAVSDSSM
jgi:hypothetical protein